MVLNEPYEMPHAQISTCASILRIAIIISRQHSSATGGGARYHSSGSSSCAVCDPHRPLHYDGTPFGLVLDSMMHKSSASDGRRCPSEKLRHFDASHDALLTRYLQDWVCMCQSAEHRVRAVLLIAHGSTATIETSTSMITHTSNAEWKLLQFVHMTAALSKLLLMLHRWLYE